MILIHRDEARRSVATGRMAHLSLENSLLLEGTDFSDDEEVNRIVSNPGLFPVILYPSAGATNLTRLDPHERARLFPADRELVVFVIDGTWRTARRMRRLSRNLHALPEISLEPRKPSGFLVRKQPRPECLSTIEAIHEVIDLLSPAETRHHGLLDVFHAMVRVQAEHEMLGVLSRNSPIW